MDIPQAERIRGFRSCMSSSSGKIGVNGVEIYYNKSGLGSKVVLALPGIFGTGSSDFEPQRKGFDKDKFTLVTWDPRGCGNSTPPKRSFPIDYLRRDAEDAASLMEGLGFKKYSLMGWSDGGNTAAILAAKYPENIEKLVIWGANSFVTQEDVRKWEELRDISKWSGRMREPLADALGQEELQRAWNENLDTYAATYKEHGGEVYSEDLKFITAPTLILHGLKDPVIPLFHAEFLHKNISNSHLECWPDAKHNLHLRYPEKFNARVQSFLLIE